MNFLHRVATIALLAVAGLSACSKDKVREPAELVSIDKPALRIAETWSSQIGDGADGRPSGLRPQRETDGLYVAESGGEVAALDPATGRPRWKIETKARLISGPTVVDELVLLGTLDAEIIALKRADGSPVWRARASSEVLAPPSGAGNVIVARSVDGRVFGLAAADGRRLWSFDRSEPSLTLRGLSAPLIEGSRVLLGMDSGRLAAVQLANGQPVWEQPISVPSGRTELERLTDIDAALVSIPEGVLVASYGGDVALIDPADGESRWRRSIKSDAGLAAGKGNVYVADADGVVWALDLATGAAAWKNESLQYRRLSPPAFFDGHVVIADYEGYVHFLDAADGHFVARERVGRDPILAPMAVDEQQLYVLNVEGKLAALTAKPR